MNSKITEEHKSLPPIILKEALNNHILIDEHGITTTIPAEANLQHYDLLTIYWKGTDGVNQSCPKGITQQLAGKAFTYRIPANEIGYNGSWDIWYSFHKVGSDDVKTSPTTTISISLADENLSVIVKNKQINNTPPRNTESRSELSSAAAQQDPNKIVSARIHPSIGIARVGNSQNEYYIGPEYAHQPPPPFGSTRDSSGAIKRQAAKFRVYGYNYLGEAVAELTSDNAYILWEVQLANTKASWYYFDNAMDQPSGASVGRRNPLITGVERHSLNITPRYKQISGKNQSGVHFDDGKYKDTPVNLGELRTDSEGRLIVLGGHGISASPSGAPLLMTDADGHEINFNNSVDWYDDTSDGPILAHVEIDGVFISTAQAWVAVGPPDYAPGIVPFRSMYDMIKQSTAFIDYEGQTTSYTNDIVPLLFNLSNLQWVNVGFAQIFGPGGSSPIDAELLKGLAQPDNNLARFDIFSKFRAPDDSRVEGGDKMKWPQLYGDAFDGPLEDGIGILLPVSVESYYHLINFVTGNFINDLNYDEIFGDVKYPTQFYAQPFNTLPCKMQPAALDKGPLSYCCADAFHPGCELTWPMRHASIYDNFLQIKQFTRGIPAADYGDILTPEKALSADGPLHRQYPGGLTRWMALPWQGDTARCRSGYDKEFHPYLPSFWPAKVPNEVLSEASYNIYVGNNPNTTPEQRKEAFQTRSYWQRGFLLEGRSNEDVMVATVEHFDELGIVQQRPASDEDKLTRNIQSVFVEQLKPGTPPLPDAAAVFSSNVTGKTMANQEELLKQLGWTQEQWDKFRREP